MSNGRIRFLVGLVGGWRSLFTVFDHETCGHLAQILTKIKVHLSRFGSPNRISLRKLNRFFQHFRRSNGFSVFLCRPQTQFACSRSYRGSTRFDQMPRTYP